VVIRNLYKVSQDAVLTPSPFDHSWIEEGSPQAASALLERSKDSAVSIVVWECTAEKFTWRYKCDETAYFIEGSVVISSEGMPPQRFGPGDTVHFPKGSSATWIIDDRIRKIAICRSVLPAPIQSVERVAGTAVRWLRSRVSAQPAESSPL